MITIIITALIGLLIGYLLGRLAERINANLPQACVDGLRADLEQFQSYQVPDSLPMPKTPPRACMEAVEWLFDAWHGEIDFKPARTEPQLAR